jgi:hypothetical protein
MEIIPPAPLAASLAFCPRPFSGWALQTICELDASCSHFLSHTLTATDAKRQAIFVAAALIESSGTDPLAEALAAITGIERHDPFTQIARSLIVLKPREIVGAVYGSVPDGLLGALTRLGPDPLSRPDLYRSLFDLFARPSNRARAKLLRNTARKLTEARIETVLRLDPILLHQPMFDAIRAPDEVDQLHAAIALIQATVAAASDKVLREAVAKLGSGTDIKSWVEGWLAKQDRFLAPPPIQNDPDLIHLTGSGLIEGARRFRNCLRQKLLHSAAGRNAYYEWTGDPGAVVELFRLSDGRWVATEMLGAQNTAVNIETARAIRAKLEQHGVLWVEWPFPANATRDVALLVDAYDLLLDWTDMEWRNRAGDRRVAA